MIDFHCHILPNMDDGADSIDTSLAMLRRSFRQGVDVMVATSHFYGNEEYPQRFLERRAEAYQRLQDAMLLRPEVFPDIALGAEVLYFPGISQAEEIGQLNVGDSRCILIEPPMTKWSDTMLDEIVRMGRNFGYRPVIAHVDRFMKYLRDESLITRVWERNMLVQVNASYFLDPAAAKSVQWNLRMGYIHLIGSDCHDLRSRAPNLALARKAAIGWGLEKEFDLLSQNAMRLLKRKG